MALVDRSLSDSKTPKYWQLAQILRKQIRSGVLRSGARLPSVAEMQQEHQISLSTVSRVYSLLEADGLIVREQGRGTYVAEQIQKNLLGKVGLLFHSTLSPSTYTAEVLEGIRQGAVQSRVEISWLNSPSEINRVDALLLYCHPTEALAFNIPARIPQVLLFQHDANFTCVSADDFNGAYLLVKHLLQLGHRRIAYFLSSKQDSISRQRLAGYRAALKDAGIRESGDCTRSLHYDARRESYREAGARAMNQWLSEDWKESGCTAVLAHNDETAVGIIKVLTEHDLSIPDDISVVGFDGTELRELCTPTLTTIKVPLRQIGEVAIRTLAEQLEDDLVSEPQKYVLPVQLKEGNSTSTVTKEIKEKNKE